MKKNIIDTPTQTVYTEFQYVYDYFNKRLFDNKLPDCIITLQRKPNCLGYFSHKRFINSSNNDEAIGEIAINPEYIPDYPLIEILNTFVHEMCHLWQYYFGTPSNRTYHNKEWADKMESIGLMPSHTGKPKGKKTGQTMDSYPIPNGKFIESAITLVEDGFFISWFDKIKIRNKRPYDKFEWINEAKKNKNTIAINTLSASPDSGKFETIYRDEIVKKSNRKTKYVCKKCNTFVWGKPNLSLICGICKRNFECYSSEINELPTPTQP